MTEAEPVAGRVPTGAGALRRERGVRQGVGLVGGDLVWVRHATAGEMMERFGVVHLMRGAQEVRTVPTDRGERRDVG